MPPLRHLQQAAPPERARVRPGLTWRTLKEEEEGERRVVGEVSVFKKFLVKRQKCESK
jgi:hypothetical protein